MVPRKGGDRRDDWPLLNNSGMPIDAAGFARRWEVAWNAHDLDELLGHFSDHVVFTSPIAAQLIEGSGGVIRGKDALRDYWALGLKLIPDLRFTVEGVCLLWTWTMCR